MLCEVEMSGSDVTGVGPARVPFTRCVNRCCSGLVKLQIRGRYKIGSALLCAAIQDGVDPDTYYTESSAVIVYHRFNGNTPIGDCTYTFHLNTGPLAVVSGSTSLPDCDGELPEEITSPDGCTGTMYDPPATHVTSDPAVISFMGDTATKDDVRSAAIAAMDYGDWSDWTDFAEIDVTNGTAEVGYLTNYLAGASCGHNGLGGGNFQANASSYESELRVMGSWPVSVSVSEGADLASAPVNRYTIEPGSSVGFSVSAPSFAPGWVTDVAVLRCCCPVQFAPA